MEGLDVYRGHKVKVLAKNEHYVVRYVESSVGSGEESGGSDGAVMACTPDLICMVDSDTGKYNQLHRHTHTLQFTTLSPTCISHTCSLTFSSYSHPYTFLHIFCTNTHTHTHSLTNSPTSPTHTHTLGYPITTEVVRYGLRVGILALPANPRLLTPLAMEVVGPAAFGCPNDIQYHPPRSLQDIGKTLLTE